MTYLSFSKRNWLWATFCVTTLGFGANVFSACSVESEGGDTGGVSLGGADGLGGMSSGEGGAAPNDPKLRGFIVVNTDRDSANVSLLDVNGDVLSESFISSSSADAGLSAALSGDVVLPSTPLSGSEMVLLDRYPAGVLTWVDFKTAEVRAQLSVATGFSSNPHDYVPYSETKAFVTRFGGNAEPGEEQFDAGNDVLVIDPSVPEIAGRIAMNPALAGLSDELLPRADRALLAGGLLRVLNIAISADYASRAETRLVTIDPEADSIVSIVTIPQFTSCANLSLAPDGERIAVACNGAYGQDPADGFPDAGIAIYDVGETPTQLQRFTAADLGGEQLGTLDFATDDVLFYTTSGRYNEDRSAQAAPDTVRRLDLSDDEGGEPLIETKDSPFNIGDVRCIPSARVCLVADAETEGGVVHHFTLEADGAIADHLTIEVDTNLGLPPRNLGEF